MIGTEFFDLQVLPSINLLAPHDEEGPNCRSCLHFLGTAGIVLFILSLTDFQWPTPNPLFCRLRDVDMSLSGFSNMCALY